jgi:hypothetical protein
MGTVFTLCETVQKLTRARIDTMPREPGIRGSAEETPADGGNSRWSHVSRKVGSLVSSLCAQCRLAELLVRRALV